ncbi:hypothetical protein M011DRAFT_404567 [Sporormia fimetaria CBS 119925]|uniref:Uncharacterized protein n=1 Tax=Sporormia fimetaria CBS 119925 TaxID=1340428 RepID=A0A6A6V9T1_9PLEO|nr:hypothetical protein M011DRAFT_404567 [Sporormia fimetaria CBS 119925]
MGSFYGEPPVNSISKWHPEPTFRGTYGILSTCLITMVLCVWTAVHLNIPAHGETGIITPQNRRKFGWLVMGLFAPEIVCKCSSLQVHKLSRQPIAEHCMQDPIAVEGRHDWTMVHSHYAAMGGIGVDVRDTPFIASTTYSQFALTTSGLRWVAYNAIDALPNVPELEIWDKSKASGLTKTLVCLQATWFCVQCLGRLSQSLPITLLGLNTFVHALCALLIYLLWWNKPLDIEARTTLQGTSSKAISVLLLVSAFEIPPFQLDFEHEFRPMAARFAVLLVYDHAVPPLAIRMSGFPTDTVTKRTTSAFTIATVCYGCIHLSAWDAPFADSTQRLMWIISCFFLTSAGCFFWVWEYVQNRPHGITSSRYYVRVLPLLTILIFFLGLVYRAARVFLVVECFISIAYLPDAVYRVPSWSQYFPHIG